MKGLLLIIDGLGDLPIPELGGLTPLEAAATPVLDRMASCGQYGLIDPIGPGVMPNTHSGAGMLLGMMPGQAGKLKRGPVEAAGRGLSLKPNDVAFRANFVALEPVAGELQVVDRRAGRIREGTGDLAVALRKIDLGPDVQVGFWPTEQHRGVLVLSGEGLDAAVSDTDPGDHSDSRRLRESRAKNPGAERTAALINQLSREAHRVLSAHPLNRKRREAGLLPANGIVVRGAGHPLVLDNLVGQRDLKASVVSGCNTVQGLGRLLGFRVIEDPRFTADVDTDLSAKIATALDELAHSALVFVHIKAPDIFAHDRDPLGKRDFISAIDQALAPLLEARVGIAVAADHTTNSNTGRHTPDPVPALMYFPESVTIRDAPIKFGEVSCRRGSLTSLDSHRFLIEFLAFFPA
jgi:2,3-bisphosphoglycerate-independent phosphoglycerate mutase